MQVVACTGRLQTRLEERPDPSPGPGELLLRLRTCGLCGTDLFKLATDSVPHGTVLGHEVVGTVVEAGAGVTGHPVGVRVVVPHHVPCGECLCCRRGSETMCPVFRENLLDPGGFSELFVARRRAVERAARIVPQGLADEAALFLEPAACVLRGINRSGLEEGGTAVVFGAGSMGLLHVLVLRAALEGIAIYSVDPLEARRKLAVDLGATAAFAPDDAPREAVAATGGAGADAVFDTVGGARILPAALGSSRLGGTVVLFAHARPDEACGMDLNSFFKSERRLVATYSGALGEQERVHALLLSGRLDPSPLVTDRLPLSRFAEGVEKTMAHRALKVVYYPDGD